MLYKVATIYAVRCTMPSLRGRQERETALEREAERIRVDKEKETGRLRALQERSRDEQSARDELRARRQQEEAERAWRAREQQAARTLAETEATLRAARSNQLRQHEHMLAIQAQRERVDFERVLRSVASGSHRLPPGCAGLVWSR